MTSRIIRNPRTGRLSAGFRFRFKLRAISHKALYLPIEMKETLEIKALLAGKSTLEVFKCDTLQEAKTTFNEFRKQFDFPFWAVSEYKVQALWDPDKIVTLRLNSRQHVIADIFLKRYFKRKPGRYVISKTFGRIGVTTCIQAYILWRQIYHFHKNSYTCSASDININPIKTNLCRFLHRDIVPAEKYLYLRNSDRMALFNTYRNPDYARGIDIGFVHLADMSRWNDPEGLYSSKVFGAAASGVLLEYYSLVVLEGNAPTKDPCNLQQDIDCHLPWRARMATLSFLTKNPYFLDHVILDRDPSSPFFPIILQSPEG